MDDIEQLLAEIHEATKEYEAALNSNDIYQWRASIDRHVEICDRIKASTPEEPVTKQTRTVAWKLDHALASLRFLTDKPADLSQWSYYQPLPPIFVHNALSVKLVNYRSELFAVIGQLFNERQLDIEWSEERMVKGVKVRIRFGDDVIAVEEHGS